MPAFAGMTVGLTDRPRTVANHVGADALVMLREKRPDLVLLDLLMPRVNGYEVLRQMGEDETPRDIPVVVISAKGNHEETIRADSLSLSRTGGLAVGEVMRCLRGSLDALLSLSMVNSTPEQPEVTAA